MNELHGNLLTRSLQPARRVVLNDSASTRSLWTSAGSDSAALYLAPPTPHAEVVLAIREGEPSLFVLGPRSTAAWKNTQGLSATATLVLRPGALRSAFGVSPVELRDAAIPARDLLDRGLVAGALSLAVKASVAEAARMLERTLSLRTKPSHASEMAGLAVHLATRAHAAPRAIARRLQVSGRTLHRVLHGELGTSPRDVVRLARGARLLALVVAPRPSMTLAEIALAVGYADQSHMTNDARALFGRSPRRLAREASGALIASSAAG